MRKQKEAAALPQDKNAHDVRRRRTRDLMYNTLLTVIATIFVVAMALVIFITVYLVREIDPQWEDGEQTVSSDVGASHLFYYDFEDRTARNGVRKELAGGTLNGGMLYEEVRYSQLPQPLVNAFVAVEDKRFWRHHGVDWIRTVEAGVNYGIGYTGKFGASTITQQYIKNLTGCSDYSLRRKMQEIVWANQAENRLTKQEILEQYTNIINLSHGCRGVGAAARLYFGKSVEDLNLVECATLAAIPNNPSYYDPIRFPEHVRRRRNQVLVRMAEEGYITETEKTAAMAEPVVLHTPPASEKTPVYSWYVDMVIEDVINDLCEQLGYTREQANRLLWNGGLSIETAIDLRLQETVEKYYQDVSHFRVHKNGKRAKSGMIVIDPHTGDILAVAGNIGEKEGNRLVSYATGALRPAASAIKPLSVYAPALESGILTWSTVYDDVPVSFGRYNLNPSAGRIVRPVAWPQNANHVYRGLTDVRYAIAHSTNTVAVRVLRQLTPERSFDFLSDQLEMKHLIRQKTLENGRIITDCAEAALALGQMNYGVTLRELTGGYTMLANGGMFIKPRSYYRVLDAEGKVLLDSSNPARPVISEQNACIMTKLLENVVTQGTAKKAMLFGGRIEVAGKTGTSNADCDKWFVGYTPQYLAGVWYGFGDSEPLSDLNGKNPSVGIWHDVMTEILSDELRQGTAVTNFRMADGVIRVTYCQDSGQCPCEACLADPRGSRSAVGYFVQGTEPKTFCTRHAFASDGTGAGEIFQSSGIRVDRHFPKKVYVLDQKFALPEFSSKELVS